MKRRRGITNSQIFVGLLIALAPQEWERLQALCDVENQPYWVVGEVVAGEGIEVLS